MLKRVKLLWGEVLSQCMQYDLNDDQIMQIKSIFQKLVCMIKELGKENKRLVKENTEQSAKLDNKDDLIKQLRSQINSQRQTYERQINKLVTQEAHDQLNHEYNKALVEINNLKRENRMLYKELKALGGNPAKFKKVVEKGFKVEDDVK